ncbi:LysR family transcriptional regulator [Streptomyces rimosus]|uniref:LysR family transcriptional regulator n=1 Tax=Streptomyces rimosus TaxID=1927 RepID=UPI0031DEBBE3
MVELETRELEYFLALADELHFGRAAARLAIAQPALSKAIRRIETRLGVPLFVRSSRHVELTPAGEALQEHGRHALNAVSAAVQSARRAGDVQAHLRLVLKPGGDAGLLSGILAEYALRPDARRVDILFSGPADRSDFLRDGRADVGLLYAPLDDLDGLAHETLHTENRVAIVPSGHRLAGRAAVRMSDLEGETLPRWKGVPGGDGTGPEVADVVQLLHMITMSRMIGVLPRSLVEPAPPGLVCVPVADAPPSRLVLAWNEQDRRPLVASFVAAALRPRGYETGSGVGESEVPAGSSNERPVPRKGSHSQVEHARHADQQGRLVEPGT